MHFKEIHIKNRMWNYYFESNILKYSGAIILFLIKATKKKKKKKNKERKKEKKKILINLF